VIPLRDLDRRPGIPIVTALLVAVNIAVWVYVLTLVDRQSVMDAFYHRWAFDPFGLLSAAMDRQLTAAALVPLITHQFLHAGWLHVAGNMLFLWVFGAAVEQKIGRVRFLIFYLFTGCAAAITQGVYQVAVVEPGNLVGASGAISGVLGAYIVLAPTARVRALIPLGLFITPMTLPAILLLGEWFALQIVAVLGVLRVVGNDSAHVAYFAHVGGFAIGAVLLGAGRIAGRLRGSARSPQPGFRTL
jgi:membrane associated rhomboid family serine protease